MLVKTFHEILELEEKAIITDEFSDISNNDMHIIEAIGLGEGARMSVVAKRLNITVGSLTTSMNSLVNKGYVARSRSEKDRRVVNVYLLEKGIAAYKHHEVVFARCKCFLKIVKCQTQRRQIRCEAARPVPKACGEEYRHV